MDSGVEVQVLISEVKKAITPQIKCTLSSDSPYKRVEKDGQAKQEKHEDGSSSIELYIFMGSNLKPAVHIRKLNGPLCEEANLPYYPCTCLQAAIIVCEAPGTFILVLEST